MQKEEKYSIKVKSVEEGKSLGYLNVNFRFGLEEYPIEINAEDYRKFLPGRTYEGIFKVSGMPDFVGEKDEWDNICTVSSELEKILDGENVIWEKKEEGKK